MKQENRSVVLRELRRRKEWSLAVAAGLLSRSKGLLSEIENGKIRVTDKQYEYLFEKYGGHELSKQSISGLISTGERKTKPRVEDGAIYRVLRLNSGKTLATVAVALNISVSYLSMVECGCRLASTRLHATLLGFYNLKASSFKNYFRDGRESRELLRIRITNLIMRMDDSSLSQIVAFAGQRS